MYTLLKGLSDELGGARGFTLGGFIVAVAYLAISSFLSTTAQERQAIRDGLQQEAARREVQIQKLGDRITALEFAQARNDSYHFGTRYTGEDAAKHQRQFDQHESSPWHRSAGEQFATLRAEVDALKKDRDRSRNGN